MSQDCSRPADGAVVGLPVSEPRVSQACHFTREELTRLAAECGYGTNVPMCRTFFVMLPEGGLLCNTCSQTIGAHGDDARPTTRTADMGRNARDDPRQRHHRTATARVHRCSLARCQ